MKAWCPACDTLQDITPTGEQIGEWGSASWKKIAKHPDERKTTTVGGITVEEQCLGSGRKV